VDGVAASYSAIAPRIPRNVAGKVTESALPSEMFARARRMAWVTTAVTMAMIASNVKTPGTTAGVRASGASIAHRVATGGSWAVTTLQRRHDHLARGTCSVRARRHPPVERPL